MRLRVYAFKSLTFSQSLNPLGPESTAIRGYSPERRHDDSGFESFSPERRHDDSGFEFLNKSIPQSPLASLAFPLASLAVKSV